MAKTGGGPLSCSFCGKAKHQTKKLIAGPGVYICDECVDLCHRIVDDELGARPPRALDDDIEAAAREALAAVDRLRALALEHRTPPE